MIMTIHFQLLVHFIVILLFLNRLVISKSSDVLSDTVTPLSVILISFK